MSPETGSVGGCVCTTNTADQALVFRGCTVADTNSPARAPTASIFKDILVRLPEVRRCFVLATVAGLWMALSSALRPMRQTPQFPRCMAGSLARQSRKVRLTQEAGLTRDFDGEVSIGSGTLIRASSSSEANARLFAEGSSLR